MAPRERMLAVAPTRGQWAALAALAAALVLLAVLVVAGTLTRLDQYALDHLMPWLDPTQSDKNSSAGYWRPFPLAVSPGAKILDTLTYPCSLLLSGLAVAAGGALLWRRGLRVAALAPAAAWVAGNAVEWTGKHVLTRAALYGTAHGVRIHVTSFDDSFPSGHMLRGILVALVVGLLWERARLPAALWAASVGPALVLESAHTPTDVAGGALIGLMLAVAVLGVTRAELQARRPPGPSTGAAGPRDAP